MKATIYGERDVDDAFIIASIANVSYAIGVVITRAEKSAYLYLYATATSTAEQAAVAAAVEAYHRVLDACKSRQQATEITAFGWFILGLQ